MHNHNIQFWLRADGDIKKINWEMPFEIHSNQSGGDQLVSERGEPLQRSLFLPMYKEDLNEEERKIALLHG